MPSAQQYNCRALLLQIISPLFVYYQMHTKRCYHSDKDANNCPTNGCMTFRGGAELKAACRQESQFCTSCSASSCLFFSTALFVGLLVGHALRPRRPRRAGWLIRGHMIEIDQSLHLLNSWQNQDEQLPKANSQRVFEADNWETSSREVKLWC